MTQHQKGLEAAISAAGMEGWDHIEHRMLDAIRAYIAATTPDQAGEMEVVAWDKLRELIAEYFDLGYAEGVVQRDADTMAGDAQRTLSEIEAIIPARADMAEARLREAEEAFSKPITMQDVRLYAGEGELTAKDALEAVGIELRSRARAFLKGSSNSREKGE